MTPESNVSVYAKLAFIALLDAYQIENPKESIHPWMADSLRAAFRKPTLKGVALIRVKKLVRDVILEEPQWLLFSTLHTTSFTGSLIYLASGEEPPAPKSKAPSCRSDWYADTLLSFFEWFGYDSQALDETNRKKVHALLARWAEQYSLYVTKKPDHSVYMSRFKEAFEPINKLYGGTVRINYQRNQNEAQLVLPLPEPDPVPAFSTTPRGRTAIAGILDDAGFPPPIPEVPTFTISPLTVAEIADDSEPVDPIVQDAFSAVSIVQNEPKTEYEVFLEGTKIQDLLVLGPMVLETDHGDTGHRWQDYSHIFTRWPSIGIVGDYLIFSSINYWDETGRMVHLGGRIQVDGGKPINQRDLENIVHIRAIQDPKPHCYINRARLQAGLSGKLWCNTQGLGDMEGSHKWFIVTERHIAPSGKRRPWAFNNDYAVWLVSEVDFNAFNMSALGQRA